MSSFEKIIRWNDFVVDTIAYIIQIVSSRYGQQNVVLFVKIAKSAFTSTYAKEKKRYTKRNKNNHFLHICTVPYKLLNYTKLHEKLLVTKRTYSHRNTDL